MRKKYFFDFSDEILDFGSLWRPHRTFNQYILLVVLSLPIDQQLCQRILSLHYWFACSDSPKLPISRKKRHFCDLRPFLGVAPVGNFSNFDFSDEIPRLWRPHRTVNQYILLVVLSLPIDQQLCHRILSLRYWFGCSDGQSCRYLAKNVKISKFF